MRVLLLCDMEGVAGIEAWEQVIGGSPQYEEGRRLLTGEVNAAIRGAKSAPGSGIWTAWRAGRILRLCGSCRGRCRRATSLQPGQRSHHRHGTDTPKIQARSGRYVSRFAQAVQTRKIAAKRTKPSCQPPNAERSVEPPRMASPVPMLDHNWIAA